MIFLSFRPFAFRGLGSLEYPLYSVFELPCHFYAFFVFRFHLSPSITVGSHNEFANSVIASDADCSLVG